MSEDRRKNLRDMLDELDRYFEELEKDLQDSVRDSAWSRGRRLQARSSAGSRCSMGPEGSPSIQFFGDNPSRATATGLRSASRSSTRRLGICGS